MGGAAFGACQKPVAVDELRIVSPNSKSIPADTTFSLAYTTVPEEAAEKVRVQWEIDDERRLSYRDGEFTALTCSKVRVTARAEGSEASDTVTLTVTAREETIFRQFLPA